MKDHRVVNANSSLSELDRKFTYGAPELKNSYRKFIVRGLVIAVAVHAVFVSGYLISAGNGNEEPVGIINQPVIIDVKLPDLKPEIVEVPELRSGSAIKDPGALNVKPDKRVNIKEDIRIKSNDELEKAGDNIASTGDETGSVESVIGSGPGKLDGIKIEENIAANDPPPVKEQYDMFEVDMQPAAVNLDQVKRSLQYPESARIMGEEGKVTAKVLVGKDGHVKKVLSLSGPPVFHEEVRDKIRDLEFTPALIKGEAVECRVSVPFNFVLKSR